MNPYAGTGALIRLALRHDRWKLSITVATLGLVFMGLVAGVKSTYGGSESERFTYAASSAVSAVAKAFNGPVLGPSLGSISLTETFTFFSIFVALTSTLLVVRHTRANEEAGRTELAGAAAVGRNAQLAAALIVAVGANAVIGIFIAAAYAGQGLPLEGSLLAAAAMAMVGIAFAGVGAVTAQISGTTRGANGLAMAAIGAAFLVRAIGDIQGSVDATGMNATSGWISWISPIGTARNARPFADNHWWVLGALAGLFMLLTAFAFWLSSRRDLGAGILPDRRGPAAALSGLTTPIGLVWRHQRGLLLGWTSGLAVLAVSLGAVAKEVGSFISGSEQTEQVMAILGGSQSLIDAYLGFSMMLFGVAASAFAIQVLLAMRAEELSSHAELVFATAVDKRKWLLSYLAVAVGGAAFLLMVSGGISGLTYGLTVNDALRQFGTYLSAGLTYLPAVAIFCGVTVAAFGLAPRISAGIAWTSLAAAYLALQFGELLSLPEWLIKISPYGNVPRLPLESLAAAPLITMSAVAVALIILGTLSFRRRDVSYR